MTLPLTDAPASAALEEKEQRLESILRAAGSVVLGYSGGVDSTLLLRKSLEVLGSPNVLAVTAASATYAEEEIDEATRLAESLGAAHERLRSTELEDEGFLQNPPERCYYDADCQIFCEPPTCPSCGGGPPPW